MCQLAPEELGPAVRQAIEAEGMFVLAEVDTKAVVARAGYDVEFAYQWLFFHPRLLNEAVSVSAATIAEVPLNRGNFRRWRHRTALRRTARGARPLPAAATARAPSGSSSGYAIYTPNQLSRAAQGLATAVDTA